MKFNEPELCLDNTTCDKHFNAEGRMICKHGLCEMNYQTFFNETKVTIVCPLELQRISDKKQWQQFFKDLPKIKKAICSSFDSKKT